MVVVGTTHVMIVLIFIGLFLVSLGLDRIANPRLWRAS